MSTPSGRSDRRACCLTYLFLLTDGFGPCLTGVFCVKDEPDRCYLLYSGEERGGESAGPGVPPVALPGGAAQEGADQVRHR
jgi:hypothetical protein